MHLDEGRERNRATKITPANFHRKETSLIHQKMGKKTYPKILTYNRPKTHL